MTSTRVALLWLSIVSGCGRPGEGSALSEADRPGGTTTLAVGPSPSFVLPGANLDDEAKRRFYAGKALATQPWVRAPTTTDARDGLGPLYNARSCLACHVKGGRGQVRPEDGPLGRGTLVRVSVPGVDADTGGVVPEPRYGAQIQPQSVSLSHQLRDRAGAEMLDGLPGEGISRQGDFQS